MTLAVALSTPRRHRHRARQALGQRAEHRCSRHDRGPGTERRALTSGQRGKFRPVQGHRPLAGGDHRYPAAKRLPHVGQARLAIDRRACRHLHQKIRLGVAKPADRTWPGTCGALPSDRPPTGTRRPDRSEVKAVRVIGKPISRVSEPGNPHRTAVPGREPPRLLIQGTGQPPPDRAKPDKPDPQRAHQITERSRTRRGQRPARPTRMTAVRQLATRRSDSQRIRRRTLSRRYRGKRMVLDDRECRAEREILRWGKILTLP